MIQKWNNQIASQVQGLSPIQVAVLKTVAYVDMFDYPLKAAEVHRYLIGARATAGEVEGILEDGLLVPHHLEQRDDFFALAGRSNIIEKRLRREAAAEELWPLARRYGRLFSKLPFVRMVAVTGSLAVNNAEVGADIDYFIVTEHGRLWLCRALVILVVRLAAWRGAALCPNYFVSERRLALAERDLYTAHELAQMVPIAGKRTFFQLWKANSWLADFLPNAGAAHIMQEPSSEIARVSGYRVKRLAEALLRTPPGGWVEAWEMRRKVRRFSRQANGDESAFSADWCKGHFDNHGRKAMEHYASSLSRIQSKSAEADRLESGAKGPNKTDILFGQSYFLKFDPKLWAAMQPYPPLGTLYAASVARQNGYQVALFDAMLAESEEEWAAALDREKPRFAVIYEDNFNYLSKMCLLRMRKAAFTMIDMARQRGCTVIVCGSDATDHAEQYLRLGADYVLLGEGEKTLGELLDALNGKGDPSVETILGLAYEYTGRSEEGNGPSNPEGHRSEKGRRFRRNPRRPDIKDVDALPFPAWDLVDVPRYRQIWLDRHGYYSMNMVTTRGCPYHCNWCAKPIWGQRYNSRSPENVVAELKMLKETYRPDHIWFADDIMGLKPGWWQRFAHLIEEQDTRIPFKCLSRADLVVRSSDEVEALKRAGCEILWMGAESGSQKILNAMEKGTKVEQIYEASRLLQEAGIKVAFFLQFGYPGETREDIELTLQMVRDCLPDDIGMSVSYPLPGTQFYDSVKLQLGHKQNWVDSADLEMLYQGPFSTAFYRQLHVTLHKEFRARRGWAALRRALRRPMGLRGQHLREAAAVAYRLATLPMARAKLNRLMESSPDSLRPPQHMTLEEAARPSPQE